VPRGERPLGEGAGPVVDFARDLRALREQAGLPTYRELSARAHYSAAALSEAAGGRKLPSLPVTIAYVTACGGDTTEWEKRWRTTTAKLAAAKEHTSADVIRAPYLGLTAFRQQDADLFFGRDDLVADLLTRLVGRRFLGVFGASGCGKSSLLRAGLAARLPATQTAVVFTPGHHPLEECALALAPFLGESPGTLRAEFAADPRNLHRRIRQATTRPEPVLVVDQFEELFTLCGDERERDTFVDALVTAATDPASRTRVVLGVRADFLGHCGQHPGLVTALRDAQVLVGAMTTDELRKAIIGPAERAGLRVETALVARLVADATQQPGMLPLVSHALLQTWLRRQGTTMTLAGYEAVGGIEHALARSADETYEALDAGQQKVAQQVFLRLTALGDGTEDTKRRIARQELDDPDAAPVLDTLTRARLITVDHGSVEIAHEALIRHWPRLCGWLADDRDGHRAHRHLTDATTEWERHDRDDDLLYRGARLAMWQDRPLDWLNDKERTFLTASRAATEREQRTRRRQLRYTIGTLTGATVVVTVFAVIAFLLATRADDARAAAVGRQLLADARAQLQLDPELALLLARAAYHRMPGGDTESMLRQAFADSHVRATLPGHQGGATGVAFDPGGTRLVTTDGAGTLRLWDWSGGHVSGAKPRVRGGSFARSPVFSPDGTRVAAIDGAGAPVVYDVAGDRVRMVGFAHVASSIAWSPDGRFLASGGVYGDVVVAPASGGGEPLVLHGQGGTVHGLSFSPDGTLLACGGADGRLWIFDLTGHREPVVLTGHVGRISTVRFSPDGGHVVTGGADGTVRIWDTTTGSVVLGRHGSMVNDVAYSADGKWVASAGQDRTVRVWNAERLANPVVLRGHDDAVGAVTFSPDGRSVVSAGNDGTAKVWAVDGLTDLTVLRGGHGPVWSVAAGPDGRHVAGVCQDGTALLWDRAGDPVVLAGHGSRVTAVTFSSDGRRLATVDASGTALERTVANPGKTWQLSRPPDAAIDGMAYSPDGTRLAVIGSMQTLEIWNEAGTRRAFHGSADPRAGLVWSPDGQRVAARSMTGAVLVWDVHRNYPTVVQHDIGWQGGLSFSPDGRYLAGGGVDGTIRVWDISGRTAPAVLSGHQGGVLSVTFSPDGRTLTSSSDDGTVRIWQVGSTSPPLVLDSFRASTDVVVPFTDGRYVTAHDDGTIRIWRCDACRPIAEVLAEAGDHLTRDLTPEERRTYL
jgi:WD40 repeat protein